LIKTVYSDQTDESEGYWERHSSRDLGMNLGIKFRAKQLDDVKKFKRVLKVHFNYFETIL